MLFPSHYLAAFYTADPQAQAPEQYCALCESELYEDEPCYCFGSVTLCPACLRDCAPVLFAPCLRRAGAREARL